MKNACMQAAFATRAVFRELNKTKTGKKGTVGCILKTYVVMLRSSTEAVVIFEEILPTLSHESISFFSAARKQSMIH